VGRRTAASAPWSRHGMVSKTRSTAAMEILMAAAYVCSELVCVSCRTLRVVVRLISGLGQHR
jgi:hypothetical protein